MNPEPVGTTNGFWMPTIVADPDSGFDREALLARFRADNVDGRVFFWPLSSLPMFDPHPAHHVSLGLPPRAVNLPSYHDLTDAEMDRVIAHVAAVFGQLA
jgi:perosamine synthetase